MVSKHLGRVSWHEIMKAKFITIYTVQLKELQQFHVLSIDVRGYLCILLLTKVPRDIFDLF